MIVGHYAAALVPYGRLEGRPLWLLLVCANVPEFLWLALALAGVEPTKPASLLDATFPNIDVHMTYSHNLVPGVIQGMIVFALVQLIWRDRPLALWCGALTVVHVLCDILVGFQHQLLGPDTPQVARHVRTRAGARDRDRARLRPRLRVRLSLERGAARTFIDAPTQCCSLRGLRGRHPHVAPRDVDVAATDVRVRSA